MSESDGNPTQLEKELGRKERDRGSHVRGDGDADACNIPQNC